jgi:hypothetical protein
MAVPRIGLGAVLPPVPTDQPRSMGGPGTGGITGLVGPGGQVLPPPPAPARPPATTADGQVLNAQALLRNFLDSIGLGSLYDRAQAWIAGGFNADYVLFQLRQTPEYQQRFPGMALRAAAGRGVVSEGEYLALERSYRQAAAAAGMPAGLFDAPDDVAKLIGNDVSPSEFQARITDGYLRVNQAPPEIRQAFGRIFGTQGDQALAAVFVDPDRTLPALEKMVREAEVSGTAVRFGLPISDVSALKLADYGVDRSAAEQGFAKLQGVAPLFEETASEATDLSATDQGVAAAFLNDPAAALAIQRRQQGRQAAFEGGGGALTTQGGTGLGSATQGGGV